MANSSPTGQRKEPRIVPSVLRLEINKFLDYVVMVTRLQKFGGLLFWKLCLVSVLLDAMFLRKLVVFKSRPPFTNINTKILLKKTK